MEKSPTHRDNKVYSIFGAGPSGLYTAWRLASGYKVRNNEADEKEYLLNEGDTIDMYDWAKYCFYDMDTKEEVVKGERMPGGRICTHYYKQTPEEDQPKPEAKDYLDNPFVEVGGMRYAKWNPKEKEGQRLISHLVEKLKIGSQPFETCDHSLMYINGERYYNQDTKRPPNADEWNKAYQSLSEKYLEGFAKKYLEEEGRGSEYDEKSKNNFKRYMKGDFYKKASYINTTEITDSQGNKVQVENPHPIYTDGQALQNIGFWNFLVAEPEIKVKGYQYLFQETGYDSMLVNDNTAYFLTMISDYKPGAVEYLGIEGGYSSLFSRLYMEIVKICKERGIKFKIHGGSKLTSIYLLKKQDKINDYKIGFSIGDDKQSFESIKEDLETDYAFMCMPRQSIELIAQTTSTKPLFSGDGSRVYLFNHSSIIKNI